MFIFFQKCFYGHSQYEVSVILLMLCDFVFLHSFMISFLVILLHKVDEKN